MRLLITAIAAVPGGGPASPQDLVIDTEDDATVGDLAAALTRRLGAADLARSHAPLPAMAGAAGAEAPHLRVVRTPPGLAGDPQEPVSGQSEPAQLSPEDVATLYVGSQALDVEMTLADSPVRHGSIVGLGQPVADLLGEPEGLVEVRISSGPGAGVVARLSTGDHVVGSSPHASVAMPPVGLPEVCLTLRVHPDGTVELDPDETLLGVHQQPVWRSRILPGPIVLDAEAEIQQRKAGESTYSELPPGTRVISADSPTPLLHLDREEVRPGQQWEP